MNSILEELYYGNIDPASKKYAPDSTFVQTARLKQDNLKKLMEALNDSEKELFEKYCDAQGELESISRYDTFTYALKFGALFMTEVLMGRSEITGE